MRSSLSHFLLWILLFMSSLRTLDLALCPEDFLLWFFPRSSYNSTFVIHSYNSAFVIHFEFFFFFFWYKMWGLAQSSFFSFFLWVCGCPVPLASSVAKRLPFLHWIACTYVKTQLGMFMWIYFCILYSVPLICVCLLSVLHSLDCCSCIITLEIEWSDTSPSILFQKFLAF